MRELPQGMYCLHAEHVSIVQPRSHIRRSSGATQSIEITFAPRHPQSTPQHPLDTPECAGNGYSFNLSLSKITLLTLHALRSTVEKGTTTRPGDAWALGGEEGDPEEEGIIAGLIGHGEDADPSPINPRR